MDRPAPPTIAPLPAAAPAIVGAWLIGALLALQPLSTDLYLPTLPAMAREFGAGVAAVQWTLSIFIAVFGAAQLIAGPLSDRFGRRPLIVGGAALFTVGSVVCLVAPDIATLIAARALQAAGSCACIVAVRAVVRDQHQPQQGARMLAAAGTIMGFAPMFGPLAGALLHVAAGWRSNFLLLTAAGALLTGWTALALVETNREPDPAATGPARLAATYREIARSPVFRAYALANTTSYAGLFTFLSASSFVLMKAFGLSPIAYALGLGVNGASYIVGTLACRRLMAATGLVPALRAGAALQAAAGIAMVVAPLAFGPSAAAVLAPQALFTFAHGIVQPVAQAGCIAPFPRNAGAAAALMGFMIQVSAAGAGMLVGATWNGTPYPMAIMLAAAGIGSLAIAIALAGRAGRAA